MRYEKPPSWAKSPDGWAAEPKEAPVESRRPMRMKDMSEEKEPEAEPISSPSSRFPYGLALRLTEKELEKLGLDDEVEVGDFLHGVFMGKVTHVSHHANEDNKSCSVEIQIVAMGIEDEATEYQEDDDEDED